MKKLNSFVISLFLLCNSVMVFGQGWLTNSGSLFSPTSADSYVGIGVVPTYKLDVNGKVFLRTVSEASNGWKSSYLYWNAHSLVMGTPVGVYSHNSVDLMPGGCTNGKLYSQLRMYTATWENRQTEKIELNTEGNCWFNNSGNFGIGTTTPKYKLDVNGAIRAHEILVTSSSADFVFDKNYNLRSLGEVETFIEQNNHLPDVQSATDMETNGVNVNEFQITLLQKIEELTLYIIQQDKQIQSMQQEINHLKQSQL